MLDPIDDMRRRAGFLTVSETLSLADRGIIVLDPFSTLISPKVAFSRGVKIWPGVTIECASTGIVIIADDVVLHSGTRIAAKDGQISVGKSVEIGDEGGFTIRVERTGDLIEIGEGARILGGGSMTMSNVIGNGAQILGPIRLQNCRLSGGGTYRDADPDKRGAVLKGSGVARNIDLPRGKVIQAFGLFSEAPVRDQSFFHPPQQT